MNIVLIKCIRLGWNLKLWHGNDVLGQTDPQCPLHFITLYYEYNKILEQEISTTYFYTGQSICLYTNNGIYKHKEEFSQMSDDKNLSSSIEICNTSKDILLQSVDIWKQIMVLMTVNEAHY